MVVERLIAIEKGGMHDDAATSAAALFLLPFAAAGLIRSLRPGKFTLTIRNTFCEIGLAASLRAVAFWIMPEVPFGFPFETAFSFAGIGSRETPFLPRGVAPTKPVHHPTATQSPLFPPIPHKIPISRLIRVR